MVRILALEATEAIGSVAAAIDDKLLQELQLEHAKRSAQSMAPAMRVLLERVSWRPAEVELVATTIGPGSFTGLRVGVATAKVFAYAVGAAALGIDTLAVIAEAAPASVDRLSAAVDAQRGDVVAATFQRGAGGHFEPVGPGALMPIGQWLESLAPGTVVSGPALKKWSEPLPPGISALAREYWPPMARHLARLAYRYYAAGRRDDIWNLVPVYSRRAAAEEKSRVKGG